MKEQKNGTIDIYKFVLAVIIAYGHVHIVGLETSISHLTNLVEGFLLITGFYTNEHFKNKNSVEIKEILVYTYRKFKRFLMYVIISEVVAYSIVMIGKPFVYGEPLFIAAQKWLDFPIDALLLNSVSSEILYFLPQLWTLSNMLIVFPGFCFFCCLKNKSVKTLISLYFPLLFYARLDAAFGTVEFPTYILRAIAGMLIGVFVNELWQMFSGFTEKKGTKTRKIQMFVLANSFVIIAFLMTLCGVEKMRLITLFEIVGLALLLNENLTITVKGNRFTSILGKASMILYIWHMVPIIICQYLFFGWSLRNRVAFVFSTEIIGTILLLLLGLLIDKRKEHKEL